MNEHDLKITLKTESYLVDMLSTSPGEAARVVTAEKLEWIIISIRASRVQHTHKHLLIDDSLSAD